MTFLLCLVCGALLLWLRGLRRTVAELSARLAAIEKPLPPTPEAPLADNLAQAGGTGAVPSPAPARPAKTAPPPLPPVQNLGRDSTRPSAPRAPIDWEQFFGVKLFAWLGGLALFLGIVFLVKYSFENNLVTPLGRVAIGATAGLVLLGTGWRLARGRYRATAQSLGATGIVILYADLFAAHSFYGLISLATAFFAMAAVTIGSFLLAVNLNAQVVAVLGLIGGFLTPVLLPASSDNARELFLYIAFLDLGLAAMAQRRRWHYLVLLAALGTVGTQINWAADFVHGSAQSLEVVWIFLGFEALFLAIFFCRRFALRSAGIGAENKMASAGSDDLSRASQSEASTASGAPKARWLAAAAAVTGFTALIFGFWTAAIPALGRSFWFFFGFVFLADAGVLALPVLGRTNRFIALAAGSVTFLLVAIWIEVFAAQNSLAAALGAIVLFALLHAATTPASAWRPRIVPFTAMGTITPFFLLILLLKGVTIWNPTPLFAVALVLCTILLGAAILRRADWLALAALIGSGLTELAWQHLRFTNAQALPALVCYGLLLLLFVAYPFCSAEKEKSWAWAISALAQAVAFWLFDRAIVAAFPNEWMGLLPAVFVLPAAIGLFALQNVYGAEPARGDARMAWQGGALLLFVSLIFPLQFDREWITLGWAFEGFALLWLYRRVPHRGLRIVALLLLTTAFVRLAVNPAVLTYHKRTETPIWNWYLYAYGVTTACLLGGAAIFGAPRLQRIERAGPAFLGSLGVILAFLLLNLEIADYFSIGPTLTFSFSGNFARDMTYSIAWALFALGLLLAGMRLRQKAARYAGVAWLGVTLAKLFLHDLSDLDELYRIGAFIGVALILITASFLYQRFLSPAAQKK